MAAPPPLLILTASRATGGELSPRWSVGVSPNGGYLSSILVSAMRNEIAFRDALTMTSHFLSAPLEGLPCDI